MGYNVNRVSLKDQIVATMTSIKRAGRTFPPSYGRCVALSRFPCTSLERLLRFVTAESWSDAVRALRSLEATNVSPMDDWVHLKESHWLTQPLNLKEWPGMRIIVYKELADLPSLLSNVAPLSQKLRLAAEGPLHNEQDRSFGAPTDIELDMDQDPGPDERDGDGHIADVAVSAENNHVEQLALSEAEISAAQRILKQYRRYIRCKRAKMSTSSEALSRYFKASLETAAEIPLNVKYRVLYQGPLLHALVSLDKAHTSALSTKQKTIRQLKNGHHADLEDAQQKADEARYANQLCVCLL